MESEEKFIPLSRIGTSRPEVIESANNPFYIITNESNGMTFELHVVPDDALLAPLGYVGAYHEAVGLVTWYHMYEAVTLSQIEDTWDDIVEECEEGREVLIA